MKLEVGKKYRVRNTVSAIVYVEVLKNGDFKSCGGHTVLVVAHYENGTDSAFYYHANGSQVPEGGLDSDIVAEYREPIRTEFYAIPTRGVVSTDDLYLSRAAAEANAHGHPVIKLKVEEVQE
jgi:hypothetical protein